MCLSACACGASGDADRLKLYLEYLHPVDAACLGVWQLPLRRRVRCATRSIQERLQQTLGRHLRRATQGAPPQGEPDFDPFAAGDLSIVNAPYVPPAPGLQGLS